MRTFLKTLVAIIGLVVAVITLVTVLIQYFKETQSARPAVVIVVTATISQPLVQPTASQSTTTSNGNLNNCTEFAKEETRIVSPRTFALGDIVIDGTPQHDWKEKEGTIAFFERKGTVYARWGAGCLSGDISLLNQVIKDSFAPGCDTGCTKMRVVIVRSDGQQEVTCYYPNGTTAKLQSNGNETWCP